MVERLYSSSELLQYARCTRKAFRVYLGRGLVPPEMRRGKRRYAEPTLYRLRLIAALRNVGLSLNEIGDVLSLHDNVDDPAGPVVKALDERLTELVIRTQERIDHLRNIRDRLVTARETLVGCKRCDRDLLQCKVCAVVGGLDPVSRTLLTNG